MTESTSEHIPTSAEVLAMETISCSEYTRLAMVTETQDPEKIAATIKRFKDPNTIMRIEFLMDQNMRLGKFLDNLKRHIYYGAELEPMNMIGTEFFKIEDVQARIDAEPELYRTFHGILGITTETPEMMKPVYEYLFLGKEMDKVNLSEEFGDVSWYQAIGINSLKQTWDRVKIKNIAKLFKRFVDGKFTEKAALNRDLEGERKILES